MQDQLREAAVVESAGHKAGRRAETVADSAVTVLSLIISALALMGGGLRIPAWMWVSVLVLWWVCLTYCSSSRLGTAERLALYGCAVLASRVLLVAAPVSSGSMIVVLLMLVAAAGTNLWSLRGALTVVTLNSLVALGYFWTSTHDLLSTAGFTTFSLILHLSVVFLAYASLRETRLRAELEQKNLDLEAAAVLLAESAASAERLRISRDLHDLIGHHLTVLNLELEAAKHRDDGALGEHVGRAGTLAKDLLADVRGTVGELRAVTPHDLQQSLERLAGTVPSLEVHVDVESGVQADDDAATTVVRAAQEIIANTIKHAYATELALSVTAQEGMITLTGANDGAAPSSISAGTGLTSLQAHLESLGGSLEIRSSPYFTVVAQLPS